MAIDNQDSKIGLQGGDNKGTIINNFDSAATNHTTSKNLTLIPARNPHFVGRKDELTQIEQMLAEQDTVYIVNGIGGIGKSELATHYLLNHQDAYQHIAFFQFSAESNDFYAMLFNDLKDSLNLYEDIGLKDILRKIQALPKKCLFVFDDLKNESEIKKLKPLHHNCDVLITTRLSIPDLPSIHLAVLTPEDARKLFLTYYPTEENIDDIL
ncbi:MAG: hypothetical protein KAH08_07265 [Methylococcales bacterium]|nr:hypothetical protein [Methylococcales bacterium]MCK5898894.1 hypothetical protein [Methylococcales bacterium]